MTTIERAAEGRFTPAFPLDGAKLRPMTARPGTVPRRRFTGVLATEPPPRIVSLMAPAGYGKTTLLAQLTVEAAPPVTWLTVDAFDNDPAVLLTYLAAALDAIVPLGPEMAAALSGSRERVMARAVPRLASAIHGSGAGGILVLDDLHRLVDREALDALAALIDMLPPTFTVVIAGRREPGLPLGRYRERGWLVEIPATALALDAEETAELARETGWALEAHEARDLVADTEGWAAAVYLECLAHARAGVAARPLRGATGERYIDEYLRSEVLDRLGADDRSLLASTSILEFIDPALAGAVTGIADAGPRLADLAGKILLIRAVGSDPVTYRCHKLLRDCLRKELGLWSRTSVSELHRRAADWYLAASVPQQAVHHLLAAGDADRASRVLAAVALPMLYRGNGTTLDRLFGQLDRAAFQRTPSLAAIAAWICLLTGQAGRAMELAAVVDAATVSGPSPVGAASFETERAMLRAITCRNGPADAMVNAQLAVDLEPPTSPWRSNALWLLGAAHRLRNDLDAADRCWEEAVEAGARTGATSLVSHAGRASIAIRRGAWAAAREHVLRADAQRIAAHYDGFVVALIVDALAARIAIHEGDLATARARLVNAQLVRPNVSYASPWYAVDCLLELARAYLEMADIAGARQALRDAEEIIRVRPALGALTDELLALHRRLDEADPGHAGASALTTAELRVLLLLPTYLSFQEIADRLSVSRNTVKSHAMSIYGKLQTASRGAAVERAVDLGLLEPTPVIAHHMPHHDGDAPQAPD